MNTLTRAFKAEEALVMVILEKNMNAQAIPMTLKAIEKATGEKGQRTAVAEHHAFLTEHGIVVEGVDPSTGDIYEGRWELSNAGLSRIGTAIRDGRNNANERIAQGKIQKVASEEIKRLERILAMLPAERAARTPVYIPESEEDEEVAEPILMRKREEAAGGPANTRQKRRQARAVGSGRAQGGGERAEGPNERPDAPAAPVAGQRRGPTAPPRKATQDEGE